MVQDDEKWFYKQGVQENGPFTTEEMNNLIQKGELKLVTSVKRIGQEWNAAESFKELHFEKLENSIARPWSRYWARGLDMLILGFLMGILMSILPTISFNTRFYGFFLGIATLILAIPFEACLLRLWGTTPGKWILGISIRDLEGQKPKLRKAFQRSVLVWWRGQGAGLPIVSLIFHLRGYQQLKYDLGMTTWDRDSEVVVSYRTKSWWGELLVWLAAVLIIYFRIISFLP
ncbi:RDD family protein [Paenibacillus sp. P36]|uniref:RDD family protein n=1 Tax=Paenibacillus sp. P36 TaxID=3342538 RepID=UPI0038B39B25